MFDVPTINVFLESNLTETFNETDYASFRPASHRSGLRIISNACDRRTPRGPSVIQIEISFKKISTSSLKVQHRTCFSKHSIRQ